MVFTCVFLIIIFSSVVFSPVLLVCIYFCLVGFPLSPAYVVRCLIIAFAFVKCSLFLLV